jgi:hypothetical protein
MKQFTCTEEVLKFAHPETGGLVVLSKDDKVTLPSYLVDQFCASGWGTADGVQTGVRKTGVNEIAVPDVTKTSVESKNG